MLHDRSASSARRKKCFRQLFLIRNDFMTRRTRWAELSSTTSIYHVIASNLHNEGNDQFIRILFCRNYGDLTSRNTTISDVVIVTTRSCWFDGSVAAWKPVWTRRWRWCRWRDWVRCWCSLARRNTTAAAGRRGRPTSSTSLRHELGLDLDTVFDLDLPLTPSRYGCRPARHRTPRSGCRRRWRCLRWRTEPSISRRRLKVERNMLLA